MHNLPENIIPVAIPVELARFAVWQRSLVNKYETNRLIKALDTFLILKADSNPSYIQNWFQQKDRLLLICKCSEGAFRSRLKLLQTMKLIKFTDNRKRLRDSFRLASWKEVGELLEIDTTEKTTIQYDYTDRQRVQERIMSIEIQDNQARQDYAILKHLNKNADLKINAHMALLRFGADPNKLKDSSYFLSMLRSLYLSDFIRQSEIHDLLVAIRPDNNRGVRGMATAWKCKHPSTVSYWKKTMASTGVIDVQKLQVQSEERVRNKQCRVLWLKGCKQTLLCLCDQISVLMPWVKFGEKEAVKQAA